MDYSPGTTPPAPAPAPFAFDEEEDEPDDDYRPPKRRGRWGRRERSGMVSAIAILYLLNGLLHLACSALLLVGGAYLAEAAAKHPKELQADNWYVVAGTLAGVLALIVIILGIPDLLAAYGIWNRRHWGYVFGLVLAGINGLWAVASIFWGSPCNVVVSGSCSIFAFVVLLNSRYAAEFS